MGRSIGAGERARGGPVGRGWKKGRGGGEEEEEEMVGVDGAGPALSASTFACVRVFSSLLDEKQASGAVDYPHFT